MHRTEANNPLGLEVNLKLSEAVCPAFSEPGEGGLHACSNRASTAHGC